MPRKSNAETIHDQEKGKQMRMVFDAQTQSRITHVSFRSSISGAAQYQHLHVEATAEVAQGDDPSKVLDGLKVFVAQELHRARFGKQHAQDPSVLSFEDIFKHAQRRRVNP